jgi:transcriptional regulator with XRE-family HTH domain
MVIIFQVGRTAALSHEKRTEINVGEKIKELRLKKNMDLPGLAELTGFSTALLSQMENHLISPPLSSLGKIARALGVEMGYFFGSSSAVDFTIVRRHERRPISRVASKEGVNYGYSYESLAYEQQNRHMEPFLVTLEPATVKNRNAYSHEGEEFIFVLEGKMEVILGEHRDILEPGDSIYFNSLIPHRVQCCEGKETKIVAVIYTPG